MKRFKQFYQRDQWVRPFLFQNKWALFWAIFLSFMTMFSAGALMFTSGYLISRSAQHPGNILLIYVPIVLTRAFGIGRPVFRYTQRLVAHNWVFRVVSKTRRRLYQAAEQLTGVVRNQLQTGKLLGMLSDDIDHLQNLYLRTIFPLGAGVLLYAFVVIGLGQIDWAFALFWAIVLFGLIFVLPIWSLLHNRAGVVKQKTLQSQQYTQSVDAILGLQDWILAGRQKTLNARQATASKQLTVVKNTSLKFGWWRNFVVQMIVLGLVIATLFWTSQFFNDWSTYGVDMIAAFSLAIFPLVDSLIGVNEGISEASFYEESINRLNELPAEPTRQTTAQQKVTDTTIQFNQTRFGYDTKHTVLKDLTFSIQPGEHIGLLGRSGSGKTTLLKLLIGELVPDRGTVKLGGVASNQLGDQRYELISVLDQRPYLFDMTIEENLKLANPKATKVQMTAALKQAGLSRLIHSLPDGLQTNMQEAGSRFSGGEQQRFSLARVLLRDTPIVILDEPTVSLDPQTEQAVLKSIFKALTGKTVIWVTHHLSSIEYVEQVYFLADGQFEMSGQPQQLARDNQHYQQLLALDEF